MKSALWSVVAVAALLVGVVPPLQAAGEPTVRFNAVGDFGIGTNGKAVLSTIGGLGDDLTLALGDLSYTTAPEEDWCALVTQRVPAGYPFELLAGNHESNGQHGSINNYSACLPNQLPGLRGTYGRQYVVDVPRGAPLVRFVNISPGLPFPDGVWDYSPGSARYAWTAAQIDGARAAGIPWVVVSLHAPCLSMGEKTCESGAGLMNMLIAKKVDLVLSGHDHVYQRTAQLAQGPGCSSVVPATFTAACVTDADSSLAKGAGTVFTTVGVGGVEYVPTNPADPEAPYFVAASGTNYTSGPLQVSVTADQLTAQFVRAIGGTFADAFTITRSAAPVNQAPVAAATAACTALTCTVDGSGSTDPDGSIATYAWSFGDGGTGSGPTASHTYTTAGTYAVVLTVTDNAGATASTTRTVTVAPLPPVNQPPTASFTVTCADLVCSLDGSASSDADGTIVSHAWAFGDGTTGTGVTGTHAYAAAGTYPIVLTVTDNAGASATSTRSVTVTAPPVSSTIAADTFSRTVTAGWGTADLGGLWTAPSATSSVAAGVGSSVVAKGSTQVFTLGSLSTLGADVRHTIGFSALPTGSGFYDSTVLRRVSGVGEYRAKARITATGTVGLSLTRVLNGTESALAAETTVAGVTMTAADRLSVRAQVVTSGGVSTVQAKVWKVGTAEPGVWQRTAGDSTAGLQSAGSVGLLNYLSSSATAIVTARYDDLVVTRP